MRNPAEWPAGAKPVTRKIQYDDLYRATRIDYVYSAGDDQWVSPFADEVASGGEATDGRRAPPSPHVAFDKRVLRQTFEYDWLGNTDKSGDDSRGFYDRSLGTIENATAGTPGVTEAKPYQLRSASNIEGAADGREGQLWTKYDVAGNLTRLDLRRVGPCLPSGDCSQRFEYRWDEVGRLERARRWDTSTNLGDVDGAVPAGTPAADLRYVYDAGDQRILKEAVDAAGVSSHTLYLFPTLELRRAAHGDGFGYDGSPEGVADYELDRWTAVPYLLANGVRLARLAYEETTAPSRDPAEMTGEDGAVNASTSQLHVFFELGDHLGSTSVVLDKATGELVERSTFLGYGATESDYRPSRWEGFREEYKFTGKEEDVEVGLQYFGKRFLSPRLGRWISADPLEVHGVGSAGEPNVFAYVSGAILKDTDPLGLCPGCSGTSGDTPYGEDVSPNANEGPQQKLFREAEEAGERTAGHAGFLAGMRATSALQSGDPEEVARHWQGEAAKQAARQQCGLDCQKYGEAFDKGYEEGLALGLASYAAAAYLGGRGVAGGASNRPPPPRKAYPLALSPRWHRRGSRTQKLVFGRHPSSHGAVAASFSGTVKGQLRRRSRRSPVGLVVEPAPARQQFVSSCSTRFLRGSHLSAGDVGTPHPIRTICMWGIGMCQCRKGAI